MNPFTCLSVSCGDGWIAFPFRLKSSRGTEKIKRVCSLFGSNNGKPKIFT